MLLNGQPYLARTPAGRPRGRHPRRLPGAQPADLPDHRGEPLLRAPAGAARGLVDRRELRRRAEELLAEVGLDVPAGHPRGGAGHRPDADGGDRPGAPHRRAAPHPRRADRDADAARGGPPLRDHPPAHGPGHRRPLHLPPPRRDEGDRRPRHGPAQRPVGGHARRGRHHGRRGHRADGRPRLAEGFPFRERRRRPARSSSTVEGLDLPRQRRSPSRCASTRARSWASRASWAPGARRPCAPSSAPTGRPAARSASAASRSASASPGTPCAPASACSPRTASRRASSWT